MQPTDGELVGQAARGDEEGVVELYDRYFNRVYDFSIRVLGDGEAAAGVVEETFRRAMTSLGDLAEREGFRVLLFSIALDVTLEQRLKVEGPTEEAQSQAFQQVNPARLSDPEQTVLAQEIAGLVWEGASMLDPQEYALLDLHLRQGLDGPEIAAALNIGERAAQRKLDRVKRETERSLSSLIMARWGSRDCEGMRRVLLGLPIAATRDQLQRATERHLRSCPTCTAAQRGMISPLEVLGALAAVPPAAGLREGIRRRAVEAWRAATAGAVGPTLLPEMPARPVGAAPGGAGGGGKGPLASAVGALGEGWHRLASAISSQRNLILPLGAGLVVLGAAGGIAWGTGAFDGFGGGAAITSPTATGTPTATSTADAFTIVTPTPTASATASPTVAVPPTAELTPTSTPVEPTETATSIPPTSTPSPEIAPSPTATPSLMPTPSATPEPTPTPRAIRRHDR